MRNLCSLSARASSLCCRAVRSATVAAKPAVPSPAQLVRLISPGGLGRAGPAGDDAMPVEQEEAGLDRHAGLVLVGRFGSGRHRIDSSQTPRLAKSFAITAKAMRQPAIGQKG